MNWLKIDNSNIDAQKLQSEIEAEIERLRNDPKFSTALSEAGKDSSSLPTPETSTALIKIAEVYASGWDTATLTRRRPILRPFLPLIAKMLKRIFKPQYIFNSLVLELLRKQEERIKALESRKTDGLSVSGDE